MAFKEQRTRRTSGMLDWADVLLQEREAKLEQESMRHRQEIFVKKILSMDEFEDMRQKSKREAL